MALVFVVLKQAIGAYMADGFRDGNLSAEGFGVPDDAKLGNGNVDPAKHDLEMQETRLQLIPQA
jgi:hypothetical protein